MRKPLGSLLCALAAVLAAAGLVDRTAADGQNPIASLVEVIEKMVDDSRNDAVSNETADGGTSEVVDVVEALVGEAAAPHAFTLSGFTTDDMVMPQGIDTPKPHFGWTYNSLVPGAAANDQRQSAYQIVLRNYPEGDEILWTSGKVVSDQQSFVAYTGPDLKPATAYHVDLTVWNDDGSQSDSVTGCFSTGLWATDADPQPWKGEWIGAAKKPEGVSDANVNPAVYLSRKASVAVADAKTIRRAVAYVAALGYYELYVDGERIGDHVLDPIYTDYSKRVAYNAYDVTELLTEIQGSADAGADNVPFAIGAVLGNGRYFAPRGPDQACLPRILFQLVIEYTDGSTDMVVSDKDWKLSQEGPITENNDFDGEVCDMRRAVPVETVADDPEGNYFFEVSENLAYAVPTKCAADVMPAPKGKLVAQMMPPMRVNDFIRPVSIKDVGDGKYILDFGQNFVGWVWMTVRGQEGSTVTLRHAETLVPDGPDAGQLYTANLRSAKARDIYTLGASEAPQYYQPRFTYHGFRFLEVTGYPGTPTTDDFIGCVVGTDTPQTGRFQCSNQTINKIFNNIFWGTRGNYLHMPTDCPQRDERQGWQGDRAEESKGEMFLFDNLTLYRKWLQDIEDSQREDGNVSDVSPNYWKLYEPNVTWPSAQTLVAESLYLMYGDPSAIASHYDSRKAWLNYLAGFIKEDGTIDKDNYGDWCVPPESPELIHSADPARKTVPGILSTAYYAYNLKLAAQFADMLGKSADAADFRARSEAAKDALNRVYYNSAKGQYDNGTQTSCILPLYFGLVPEGEEGKVFSTLVNNIENITNSHIGTGLIGGQWLNRALSDRGRIDLAYKFATNNDYPSWGYMVEKGATTIWELWNGDTADPAMNSGNHVMLVGDEAIWYFEYLAGIKADPENPGFKRILMAPHVVGDLKWVKAAYESVRGLVLSGWNLEDDGSFCWNIVVPVNSTALLSVPTSDPTFVEICGAEGVPVNLAGKSVADGRVEYEVGSGSWKITSKLETK